MSDAFPLPDEGVTVPKGQLFLVDVLYKSLGATTTTVFVVGADANTHSLIEIEVGGTKPDVDTAVHAVAVPVAIVLGTERFSPTTH